MCLLQQEALVFVDIVPVSQTLRTFGMIMLWAAALEAPITNAEKHKLFLHFLFFLGMVLMS